MKCDGCGLFAGGVCAKYGRLSVLSRNDCLYYVELQYEDGEALTPVQHLLLAENLIKSKTMKGPC